MGAMRLVALLTLALISGPALAGTLHKCKTRGGAVYYTDKTCSTKNQRDKQPALDQSPADPQQAAPPPPPKKKR